MSVYSIIDAIIKEKREASKRPLCATFIEVLKRSDISKEEIKKEINCLIKEGRIVYSRSINDFIFYKNEEK